MKNFTELDIWREARSLNKIIYQATHLFPKEELFGLTNQIRRASVSISSNIAEGCGRNTTKDTLQFLYVARGSAFEVESQLYLAFDLAYFETDILENSLEQINRVKKLINGFINYYKKQLPR